MDKQPKLQRIDMIFLRPFSIPTEYKHSIFIMDKNGKEIPDNTKIRIKYCRDKIQTYDIARLYYSDVKKEFNFHNNVRVNCERPNYNIIAHSCHLIIEIIEHKVNIPKENIKFKIKIDYWTNYWVEFWHP